MPYPPPQDFTIWRTERGLARPCYASLEDIELTYQPFLNSADICQSVLVMRHPDNMFASRIKKAFKAKMTAYPRENTTVLQRSLRIWKQHARCYLGQGDIQRDRLAIYFDAWLIDSTYRAEILRLLGLIQADTD